MKIIRRHDCIMWPSKFDVLFRALESKCARLCTRNINKSIKSTGVCLMLVLIIQGNESTSNSNTTYKDSNTHALHAFTHSRTRNILSYSLFSTLYFECKTYWVEKETEKEKISAMIQLQCHTKSQKNQMSLAHWDVIGVIDSRNIKISILLGHSTHRAYNFLTTNHSVEIQFLNDSRSLLARVYGPQFKINHKQKSRSQEIYFFWIFIFYRTPQFDRYKRHNAHCADHWVSNRSTKFI